MAWAGWIWPGLALAGPTRPRLVRRVLGATHLVRHVLGSLRLGAPRLGAPCLGSSDTGVAGPRLARGGGKGREKEKEKKKNRGKRKERERERERRKKEREGKKIGEMGFRVFNLEYIVISIFQKKFLFRSF